MLAHRGFSPDAPENTLLAFAAAIDAGAEIIETDVHATADGVSVVAHDPTLERTAGRDDSIESLLWQQLQHIPLGDDQTTPTLLEALDAFPDTRFNIDMKSDASVVPTVRAVAMLGAEDRVLLTSFSERRRRQAASLLPAIATGGSRRTAIAALAAARAGSLRMMRWALKDVDALQIPERSGAVQVLSPRMLELVQAAGRELHVWTVNDEQRMHQLLDFGVDGIVTDRIDRARRVLDARA